MNDFSLPKEHQALIYRDWGVHYKHQDEWRKALDSFERSVELLPKQYRSFLEQSICKLHLGRADEALQAIDKCLEEYPENELAKHVKSNCLYYLNRLEDTLKNSVNALHDHPKSFVGPNFIKTVERNLETGAGPEAGKLFRRFNYKYRANNGFPYKSQPDNDASLDNCDVVSLKEEVDAVTDPYLLDRRKRKENFRNEVYFDGHVIKQINFWKSLRNNDAVDLRQAPKSSKILTQTVEDCLDNLKRCRETLWSREPLFAKRAQTKKSDQQFSRLVAFLHLQQDVRRQALFQLDRMNQLARTNLKSLLQYVEKVTVEFYAVKTYDIFPMKFEYVNEVYNFVGLEYFNSFIRIPQKLTDASIEERIVKLLKVPKVKKHENRFENIDIVGTFGDRNAYKDADAVDMTFIRFYDRSKYFHDRLKHSKYPIEKAYLYYQLCELYMGGMRFQESQQYARDVIAQAQKCKSNLWIGYFHIIRCDAIRCDYRQISKNIKEIRRSANKLNEAAEVFVRTLERTNQDIEALRTEARKNTRATRASGSQFSFVNDKL